MHPVVEVTPQVLAATLGVNNGKGREASLTASRMVIDESSTDPHGSTELLSDHATRLTETGLCVLEGIVSVSLVDECCTAVNDVITTLDEKLTAFGVPAAERRRFNLKSKDMSAYPLGDQALHGSARWLPLVHAVLGLDAHELWRGILDNRPGSTTQVRSRRLCFPALRPYHYSLRSHAPPYTRRSGIAMARSCSSPSPTRV